MRSLVAVLVCLALAASAMAGDNPDINIFLEFENGQNSINPTPGMPFVVTVYLENFGAGGGVTGVEFILERSFGGWTGPGVSLLDGLEIGGPETGWTITGSCVLPDGSGRVPIAEVTYTYDGSNPGSLTLQDHPYAARGVVDCSTDLDQWCVRLDPSGHGGVGVAAPPGDCPTLVPCIEVTKEVDCDISKVGDDVEYTISVTNCGVFTELQNVAVVDDVLGNLSAYFPSTLSPGGTAYATIPYTIQAGDDSGLAYPGAIHENTVTATAEDASGTPVVDTATEQVYLIHPDFAVTKECTTPLVPPGADAEFEITIINTGDCDLNFSTDEPAIPSFSLTAGEMYMAIVYEHNPGGAPEICNEINVTATIPQVYCVLPNEFYASAEDCCDSEPDAEIRVTKEVDCEISKVGDEVSYEICIDNVGLETLYNIVVFDDAMGDLSGFPSMLLPGETHCEDFFYTIVPGDDSGEDYPEAVHIGAVTAMADNAYGVATDDTAVTEVYLIHPGIAVTKECITPLVFPGDDAEFEVTITNTGDIPLDVTTDEAQIPFITLDTGAEYVEVVPQANPGGVDEVCNEINVMALIPVDYCDLPNEYAASASDCCDCLHLHASVIDLLDVLGDQGGQIRARWLRSANDDSSSHYPISFYEVYRRQDGWPAAESGKPDSEPAGDGERGGTRIDGWDYVVSVPAHGEDVYQTVIPTLCDSTADGGTCWSTLFIRAATSDPYRYYDSPPDSAYSVDNLAPSPPGGLLADGDETLATLTWDASEEEDFDYYAIYRGVVEGFVPGEPIGFTSYPVFDDGSPPAASQWWYKVTAFDFGGNESEPSNEASVVSTGAAEIDPSSFWLGPATPNPFNPITDIQYRVPEGGGRHVELVVYDAAGRAIRSLVSEVVPSGTHVVAWDGTDDTGAEVASGVYYFSMDAGDFSDRRSMVLLK